ncbi:hypothetical protein GCM10008983_24060 [Lentibacillus halophilus]|uniref:Uncharacterized protein n=1 Tax=Lentibacillus halophilus TaxID=295065 RepID=A0ABN0ZEX1_9BACI
MGRGKNVIVGDPKQPPTDFFGTKQEEDNFDLQDLKSVLDDSLTIQLPLSGPISVVRALFSDFLMAFRLASAVRAFLSDFFDSFLDCFWR